MTSVYVQFLGLPQVYEKTDANRHASVYILLLQSIAFRSEKIKKDEKVLRFFFSDLDRLGDGQMLLGDRWI